MGRTILRLLFLVLGGWLAFTAWAQAELAAAGPAPNAALADTKRALVLWHAEDRDGVAEGRAMMTANLFGRFGRADIRPIARYRVGEARSYDAIFVLPSQGRPLPEALLSDVRTSSRPVLWVQHGAQALFADAAFARRQGWSPGPRRAAVFASVIYRNMELPYGDHFDVDVTDPRIADSGRASVLATAVEPDGRTTPWAVRSGTLYFVLESPFAYANEDGRYLAFADLLYEMVAPDAPVRHRAMVRLEDIGPEADPARIRAMADLLAAEGVPFAMSVYDTYRDPDGHYNRGEPIRFSLRQRPRLVRALEYAQARGGTLIAHGHTHQSDLRRNPYVRVSGGDFEFFAADLAGGEFVHIGPLPGNSVETWRDRFCRSARAWRRTGIAMPRIFTTPHYAGSLEAYRAAMEVYGARYERVIYFPGEVTSGTADYAREASGQFFPYEVVDHRGDLILPENLGYSSSMTGGGPVGRTPQDIIATARRNLVVRDGFASFFHHWYEDPERLKQQIRGIRQLGYRFVSPTDVVRNAPPHARRQLSQPSQLAAAAADWVTNLPRLSGWLLAGIFFLLIATWRTGEMLLTGLPRSETDKGAAATGDVSGQYGGVGAHRLPTVRGEP